MLSWVPAIDGVHETDDWHPLDTLFAPLYSMSGECIGVLSVDMPIDGKRPQADQLELVEIFAQHAALAIEHAQTLAQLQDSRDELAYAATHDALTGLANRARLMEAGPALAAGPNARLGVLVLDLDGFKAVNDSSGHLAGDEVLIALSGRLRNLIRRHDLVARSGGDEFVVVVAGGVEVETVIGELRVRLLEGISRPIHTSTGQHRVGVSIGHALAATPTDFERLLAAADADMYTIKRHTRRLRDPR